MSNERGFTTSRIGQQPSALRRHALGALLIVATVLSVLTLPRAVADASTPPTEPAPTASPTTTAPTTAVPPTTAPATTAAPGTTAAPETTVAPEPTDVPATDAPETSAPAESTTTSTTVATDARLVSGVPAGDLAFGSASSPGLPGTPQPPVLAFVDDLEAGPPSTGVVAAYGDAAAPEGWPGTPEDWNDVRTLADVLGQWGGTSPSQGNHVVAAVPAGDAVASSAIPVTPGHYYTVAVDVAALDCGAPSIYDLAIVVAGSEVPVSSAGFNVCDRPGVVAGDIVAGTALGDSPVMAAGESVEVVVRNAQGAAGDSVLDNLRLLDVTPQLDAELPAAEGAAAGDAVPLTFTVTNTTDLGAKPGWSFTATLPEGLTVADAGAGADGVDVTAEAGSNTVTAAGDLAGGAPSTTFTVDVVAESEGTYALDAESFELTGLHAPGSAEVTFGPAASDDSEPATSEPETSEPESSEPPASEPPTSEPAPGDQVVTPFVLAGPPEYEIAGDWVTPPAEVATGDPVVAQWYVNVNDSGDPPGNDPVDNVTATFTVGNGLFEGIPDACLTTGVTPVSEISADGLTLTCNLGTVNAGSAVAVQTPVSADGPTGSELSIEGSIAGQTVTPDPIPIVNAFGMDIAWQTPNGSYIRDAAYVDVDLQWTLFLNDFSEAGPDSVTYELTVTDGLAAGLSVGPNACSPFGNTAALGHPWSDATHPANQTSPFVDSCTLTQIDADTFELTLTGIDYSLAQVPTHDSAGVLLPTDRAAIASGSVWFRIESGASNTISLVSDAPTYTSESGATATDDPGNNDSNKTATGGGLSSNWSPPQAGQSWWSNQIHVSPGTQMYTNFSHGLGQQNRAPTETVAHCTILDTRWVTFRSAHVNNGWGLFSPIAGAVTEYYVGGHATVNPAAPGYDPNAFRCELDPAGWTTTPPADLSTVKAVRTRYPFASIAGQPVSRMVLDVIVNDDAPVGQDIWQWGSFSLSWQNGGTWSNPSRSMNPADAGTGILTPGTRYPFIASGRDVLYVTGATPAIAKSVDRPTLLPGQPATYTLTYSVNGTGDIPDTVDDVELVDTLPEGLTYVDGSATPAPTSVGSTPAGEQVLTWNLDDVPTNTELTLTYQATLDPGVAGGTRLTNSAVASYDDMTSNPATATVTTSTNGYTAIVKTATDEQVQITDDTGTVTLPWTVTISSHDPSPQAFTDTIDILPYNGDGRGTAFNGDYALGEVVTPDGGTVYYSTADPATLSDDPGDASNGAAGDPTGNTVGWSTAPPADLGDVTAIRVIGPELAPGATFQYDLTLETTGAEPGDVYVNRAQARSENTVLVMRTSAAIALYQDVLVKELESVVRNDDGTFDVVFTISNTRTGEGPGYDLADTLQYGDGITLNGDPVAANTDPGDGSITVVNTYDAATETLAIADDVPIADGVTHVYTVTSNVSVDGADVSFGNTDCALEGGETGTGLLNTATLTVEEVDLDAEACAELPYTTHEKNLTAGPTPNGDGTYTVEYTIDVHSWGAADDVYDLTDEFMFGESVTIEGVPTVTNTEPGDIATLGTWDAATTTLAVVTDQPIAAATADGPTTHTYVVSTVVSVDPETVTFGNTDCEMGGDDGTGLFNETTLTVGGSYVENDDACAPISEPLHTKTVTDGPTPIGDGLYEVEYTIEVTNAGAAASEYDLVDDFAFGEAVTIEGTPTVLNTVPGGIPTIGAWDPTATTLSIVDDEPIDAATPDAAEVHEYVVTVQVSVDAETVTFDNTDCTMGEGESGTGLFNTATMSVNGTDTDRTACPPISEPLHTKTITAGPELLDNGNYAVEFTIEVTNAGAAASTYDLVDDFQFSNAVTIEGTPTVTNSEPGGIPTIGTWDPDATTLVIVDDQPIVAGSSDAPTVHAYVVAVEVSVDPAEVTLENSDCELGTDEGTGLFNTATMTVNDEEAEADTCTPFPEPETTFDKSVVSAEPNGDGTYTVTYTLTVGRIGVGLPYTLTDSLRYGTGTTVNSATITGSTPDGLPVNAGWDGASDDVVAADVPIADGDTHVYEVEVNVSIDEPAVPDGASDCELGSGEDGTGFSNTATLTTGNEVFEDDGCAEFPVITLDKEIASGPTELGDGRYEITYTITVSNDGVGDGRYDLDDALRFGDGVTVESATIANATPGSIATNEDWNGEDEIAVVTDEEIAGETAHVYTVTAVAAVDGGVAGYAAAVDCTLAPGEAGTGLLNTAGVTSNGEELDDDACAVPGEPELTVTKVVSATTVQRNGTVGYTITITNSGGADFTDDDPAVVVDDLTDVLDDATWLDDAAATSGALSYAAPNLTWTGPLAVGETVTLTYSVRVNEVVTGPGELHNTVSAVLSNCPPGTTDPECNTLTRIPPPPAPPAPVTPDPIPVTG